MYREISKYIFFAFIGITVQTMIVLFYNKNPELIVKNHKYTIDKRNLYLPIPQSAIDANRLGKLRQNYGYDKYDDSVPMWGNWQEAVADEDNLSN